MKTVSKADLVVAMLEEGFPVARIAAGLECSPEYVRMVKQRRITRVDELRAKENQYSSAYQRNRRRSDPDYRERINERRRKRYATDADYRERVKASFRRSYHKKHRQDRPSA